MADAAVFRRKDYRVEPIPLSVARVFVEAFHYSGGGSNTAVYTHGLIRREDDAVVGIAWWLPPTRVACESVNREEWKRVLALSRMAIFPGVPKNACSFLLARSVDLIRRDRRFVSLVTYADESQGHSGGVYRASNWTYVGRTGPYPRWVSSEGRQVAIKATKSRTRDEMKKLGHRVEGSFHKHKFVLHLGDTRG